MKNIFKLSILLVLLALYSCETFDVADPDFSNSYPAYVELASASALTVPEGGNIPISLSSRTVIYEAYSVSYELTGDYTASGTIDVPAGVNSLETVIPVPPGIVSDAALASTLTLTAVTGEVALGRNGENLAVDVSITKFVPFVQADYAITFDCDEPGYGVYACEFITGDADNVLTNTNFWDYGVPVDYTFSADFDQTITIATQDLFSGLSVTGSGTYDGVTKTMIVDYTIWQEDGTAYEANTHTFTVPAK